MMTPRNSLFAAVLGLGLLAAFCRSAEAQTLTEVRAFDRNGDGHLDRSELVAYALRKVPSPTPAQQSEAGDFADDLLTAECSANCTRITIQQALRLLAETDRRQSAGTNGTSTDVDELRRFDTDRNGRLDRSELIQFRLRASNSPGVAERAEAEDFANDVLSATCPRNCSSALLLDVIVTLQDEVRRAEVAVARKRRIGWRGLGFSREVVDNPNPRADKLKAPAVFSYRRDKQNEDDPDQLNLLGAIQLWSTGMDLGNRFELNFTPGVDADIDGGKEANESSLTFGAPVFVAWVGPGTDLEMISLALSPKFGTDRRFDREVYEFSATFSFTSEPLAAGFFYPDPVRDAAGKLPPVLFSWTPSLAVEYGKITDAGGNADLEAQAAGGSYLRMAPRARMVIRPTALSENLRLTADGIVRFDSGERAKAYLESRIAYDLVLDGTVQFTVLHRTGSKPPVFKHLNEFLVGIGIRF
jgi:hypothetical protein